MKIGTRILDVSNRPTAAMIEAFRKIPVANISDVMTRLDAGGPTIRPMHAGGALCGPAFTVKTRPGDNLLIHHALDTAQPGDVIVVDGGGDLTNSLMGEMMLSYAVTRGIAGVILNGAIRDYNHVRTHDFPVFAAGITHRGPYKSGPGEINVAIAIDGMVIEPGDIIVGDDDGFVSVPLAHAEKILADATAKNDLEVSNMEKILNGTVDRAWVQRAMERMSY